MLLKLHTKLPLSLALQAPSFRTTYTNNSFVFHLFSVPTWDLAQLEHTCDVPFRCLHKRCSNKLCGTTCESFDSPWIDEALYSCDGDLDQALPVPSVLRNVNDLSTSQVARQSHGMCWAYQCISKSTVKFLNTGHALLATITVGRCLSTRCMHTH